VKALKEFQSATIPENIVVQAQSATIFVCANCARPGKESTSAGRARPTIPDFDWPMPVQQIMVPCSGRLQPEHVLKAFETGAVLVLIIACQEGNCHYIEGSSRCARRAEYLRSILKEIGLGEERLLLSYLPGSAKEDLALAAGKGAPAVCADSLAEQIAAIRDQVAAALQILPPNPLQEFYLAEITGAARQEEMDTVDDDEDD
jgi:F420-non-reducing hydrogenase iron-sulfur subunit